MPGHQAQAISFTLASGLIAALAGPELFKPTRDPGSAPPSGAYAAITGLGLLGMPPILSLRGMGRPKVAPAPIYALDQDTGDPRRSPRHSGCDGVTGAWCF
ncbi:hypothetical protein H4P12_09640 [Paracoccus sp. 11-3]|uniref:Uncharacterized protein n=1 Tax=Paracoccus amoyensis TaxID=2760093 RepID=A0A926G6Z6_9RHOB|nr:hypothetical protein [Paracoccus amoyensis]MBC9246973.1 hypothetical protein [Paracoccus amoyensis]